MKNKILLIGAAVLLVPLMPARAADIFGSWIAHIPGRLLAEKDALIEPIPIGESVFFFELEGTKLTGTVTTPRGEMAISGGKINGDEISFAVMHSFYGNERKLMFKGKVGLNEIHFTVEEQGGREEQPLKFIARREFQRNQDIPLRPMEKQIIRNPVPKD